MIPLLVMFFCVPDAAGTKAEENSGQQKISATTTCLLSNSVLALLMKGFKRISKDSTGEGLKRCTSSTHQLESDRVSRFRGQLLILLHDCRSHRSRTRTTPLFFEKMSAVP